MRVRLLFTVLLLTLVWLPGSPASAGGGRCAEGFTDADATAVGTSGGCFLPTVARVQAGDTVTWRNTDGVPHNVITSAGFGGALPIKDSLSHRFDERGVYPYVCTIHPGMVGAVVVGNGLPMAADLAGATLPDATNATSGTAAWWVLAAAAALLLGLTALLRRRSPRSGPPADAA